MLWGGREGYETLLNTDLRREEEQLARFLHLVAEHKQRIGFSGTLLLEPKPQEPTKHQYDYDSATVDAFLVRHDLADEYRVNIEVNHATLAGHSFHHEVAVAMSRGIFGSIDVNRGDDQNGWDTDQFPNSVDELALALYEIIRAGGFTTGGFNFDAKLRRQSLDRSDLFHAHIGGIDTLARSLLVAADLVETGELDDERERRYAGWTDGLGADILGGGLSLAELEARVVDGGIDPTPRSGGQERLENLVNQRIWAVDRQALSRCATCWGSTSRRRRPRRSSSTRPVPSSASAPTATTSPCHGRSGASRIPTCGGTASRTAIRSVLASSRREPGRPSPRSASPGRCTAPSCSTPPTVRSARRSCGTTSAPPPSATRSATRSGRTGSSSITGNDALTGFTAPKLLWVRRHEPEAWARVAHVLLPKDYVRLHLTGDHAVDKPMRPARCSSTSPRATGRRRCSPPSTSTPPCCRRRTRARRSPGRSRPARPRHTGLRPGTPVVAGGGDQAANAVGVGAVDPGMVALSLGTSGVIFAATDRPVVRAAGPRPCLLPRGAGALAPHVGDALGGGQPALVPRRAGAGDDFGRISTPRPRRSPPGQRRPLLPART